VRSHESPPLDLLLPPAGSTPRAGLKRLLCRIEWSGRNYNRFIALTQRYFGTDEWLDKGENFGVTKHAADLQALNIGPVDLGGWSYGADVVLASALQKPDLVQSLVLYEPSVGSLLEKGPAGKPAGAAAGRMFGPVTEAVKAGDAEKGTKLLI